MKLFVLAILFSVYVCGPAATATAAPECVKAKTSATYSAYAYRHVVMLKNECGLPYTCNVSTNVDPKPVHKIYLKKDESKSVVTRSNSPARSFKAIVSCSRAS